MSSTDILEYYKKCDSEPNEVICLYCNEKFTISKDNEESLRSHLLNDHIFIPSENKEAEENLTSIKSEENNDVSNVQIEIIDDLLQPPNSLPPKISVESNIDNSENLNRRKRGRPPKSPLQQNRTYCRISNRLSPQLSPINSTSSTTRSDSYLQAITSYITQECLPISSISTQAFRNFCNILYQSSNSLLPSEEDIEKNIINLSGKLGQKVDYLLNIDKHYVECFLFILFVVIRNIRINLWKFYSPDICSLDIRSI